MFSDFQDTVGTVLKDDAIPTVFVAQPESQTLKRSKDAVGIKSNNNILAGLIVQNKYALRFLQFNFFSFLVDQR